MLPALGGGGGPEAAGRGGKPPAAPSKLAEANASFISKMFGRASLDKGGGGSSSSSNSSASNNKEASAAASPGRTMSLPLAPRGTGAAAAGADGAQAGGASLKLGGGGAAAPPAGSGLKGGGLPAGKAPSRGNSGRLLGGWSLGTKVEPGQQQASPSLSSPRALVSSAKSLEAAAASAASAAASKVAALLGGGGSSRTLGAADRSQSMPPPAALAPSPAAAAAVAAAEADAAKAPAAAPAAGPAAAAASPEVALAGMSTEELRNYALSLQREKTALKQHLEDISGGGSPAAASAAAPAGAGAAAGHHAHNHRSPSLVVEFAEPRHQQRPSMIAAGLEQIRAGLAPPASSRPRVSLAPHAASGRSSEADRLGSAVEEDDEDGFIEEGQDEAPAPAAAAGTPPSATAKLRTEEALHRGPSLDPMQALQGSQLAAKPKMLNEVMEEQDRKEAEAKRRKEAAAAAAASAEAARAAPQAKASSQAAAVPAAPAAPAKPKRRYKLLSVFTLLPPNMRREEWSLHQFNIDKRLHKGYASEVYKAQDAQSGEVLAVKVYNLKALGELNKVQLIREIRLHGNFAHPNIIELYVAFQEEDRVVLAQRYAEGGDLLKALHQAGGRLTEHSAVRMVIQPLLNCLVYLHARGITHRDIKPENILYQDGVLKLADFGLAINMNEEHAVTRAGTLHYMAPEVVKNPLKDHPDDFKNEARYHYNAVVDSWAVGCLAYELIVGYPPFTANTQQQVVHNINHMQLKYPKKMSDECVDFVNAALERNPADRATTDELIKHPWIKAHMTRSSCRNLNFEPASYVARPAPSDFSTGPALAKAANAARRQAEHHNHPAISTGSQMAPF